MNNIKYGFGKKTLYSFDDAIKKVTEEGVLNANRRNFLQ
ncbi:Uncharacterised protein [Legionella bozemanae]|nr:Uncharacterised protein [Legionella bozemanae]